MSYLLKTEKKSKLSINAEKNVFDDLKWVKNISKHFETKLPQLNLSLGSCWARIYTKVTKKLKVFEPVTEKLGWETIIDKWDNKSPKGDILL